MEDSLGNLEGDRGWSQYLDNLEGAKTFTARVPSTLKAELRDYQQEGFQWLSKMAQWGMGACLADDMGLGKTIQSLALLLTKAAQTAQTAPATFHSQATKKSSSGGAATTHRDYPPGRSFRRGNGLLRGSAPESHSSF